MKTVTAFFKQGFVFEITMIKFKQYVGFIFRFSAL